MITRIIDIKLDNFKNIELVILSFLSSSSKEYFSKKANILGVYGQNGSGKTSVIEALEIVQELLRGNALGKEIADFIAIDKNSCGIEVLFSISYENINLLAKYSVVLEKNNNGDFKIASEKILAKIVDEDKTTSMRPIIDYNKDYNDLFLPKSRLDEILKINKDAIIDLTIAKGYCMDSNYSFIFCERGFKVFNSSFKNDYMNKIVEALKTFACCNMFIIKNSQTGAINVNLIPFLFKLENEKSTIKGQIVIPIDEPTVIPEFDYRVINSVIENVNKVVMAIIPGMKVGIKNYGNQLMPDGENGVKIELVSIRNGKEFALKYESDGIKKILSILNSIIWMFNNPSIFVAIDELDSGIFEYLLGELIQILEKKGKGQLLFTAHNLTTLEKLNKNSLMFTTTNKQNKFIRSKYVGNNNNLRDLYLRAVALDGYEEKLYEDTNSYEISYSLRKAGE